LREIFLFHFFALRGSTKEVLKYKWRSTESSTEVLPWMLGVT